MENSTKILAITGPFGSGKTTVTHLAAAALRAAGKEVSIIALDEVSRQILNEDISLRNDLAETFGEHILNDDVSLNRAALAELAFADDQSTAKLNALVHPPTIIAARQLIVETLAAGELPLIEMPFPTIYLSEIFQLDSTEVVIWTVTADKETRLERGIADGYSYKDALRRMDRQPRMSAYQTEADAIIENSDGLDDLRLEVQMTLESSPL